MLDTSDLEKIPDAPDTWEKFVGSCGPARCRRNRRAGRIVPPIRS